MENYYEIKTGPYIEKNQPFSYFTFPFPLDTFQLHGCDAISKNQNVLATAHTGSGKTVLALYAIAKTLAEGHKVIYTSPIKALSNQKYHEFSKDFPSIGIITGDIKINPLGDLLIMTAEILRNSLIRTINKDFENKDIWQFNPNDIKCVILDEVHYINNPDRGKIWEEIICNLNDDIQIVMLSATISGAEEMVKWVGNLKKIKCILVSTIKRPIPLRHGIWWNGNINYFLYGDNDWKETSWQSISNDINKKYIYNKSYLFNCIKYLYDNEMTPVNIFLLNRNKIEEYAFRMPYYFVTPDECSYIEKIWYKHLYQYIDLYSNTDEWNKLYKLVCKGIGIHHSSMIPILKEIVEILYSEGLIKVLLATETFALGVNMPTKTVVFYNTIKHDNRSTRLLFPEEYNQMAGRAGRRGKDDIGTVIILPFNNFINEPEAKKMILTKPQKIVSKFDIDPLFIIKEISTINKLDKDTIIKKCKKTLFYYQHNDENDHINKKINDIKLQLDELKYNYFDSINDDNIEIIINNYYRLNTIKENINGNDGIKLNPRLHKKLLNEEKQLKLNLSKYDFNIIDLYSKLKEELNIILLDSKNATCSDNIIKQIDNIIDYLINNNYITDTNILLPIGKIISEINECNPFYITTIIFNDLFNKLEFNEIAALCSIFINENRTSDLTMNNINASNNCKELINFIIDYKNKNMNMEVLINNIIPYSFSLDWSIYFGMFNYVKMWASGESWKTIVTNNLFHISHGIFIKVILRLVNLLRNIESIANLLGNVTIINILNGFQEKLIRDSVINDSLYLNLNSL
jgi:superfamily II RNA helicase